VTVSRALSQKLPVSLVASIALGTLLQALNSSMIAVALVDIRGEFHAGADASWLIAGLYLATAVAAPTMGKLADQFGPRRVFLGGISLVAVVSAAAPFAPNIGTLIALRVLLGIGTAAPYPAGLAMIRREADRLGIDNAAGGLGALAVSGQVAVALGPPLGGALVQWFGWSSVFLVNVPFVAVAMIFALRYLPADARRAKGSPGLSTVDGLGLVLFAGAMTATMLLLLSLAGTPRWYLVAVIVVLGALFVLRERRAAHPFLDLRLLTNRALTATYARTALTYVAFYMIFYGLPSWLESGRGLSAGGAGLVMLPLAAVGVLVVTVAAKIQRRHGSRLLLVVGSAAFALGAAALTFVGGGTPVYALVGLAALLGLPNGFNSMGNQTALYGVVPAEQSGAAFGLYRTSQYVGANVAAAVLEIAVAGSSVTGGLHTMGFVVLAISVVLFVTALTSRHLRRAGPVDSHKSPLFDQSNTSRE
jgi:MFS family permease